MLNSKDHVGRILIYDSELKVSIDFNYTTYSSIFAPEQTRVIGERMMRILAWVDNEWIFRAGWMMQQNLSVS